MVFSHSEVLHILIRSEFHLQLPLNIILRFVVNSKTNLKHFLYTNLKSNYNRLWFLSLHDDKINKNFFTF
jgi:hypothetical protein